MLNAEYNKVGKWDKKDGTIQAGRASLFRDWAPFLFFLTSTNQMN